MLKNTCCSICLSVDKRTINIYKSDLQYAYETLANFKIRQDECWMCYICHTRLRQCHQLQLLAVQTRGLIDDIFQNKVPYRSKFTEPLNYLDILELSTSQTKIISITPPCSYIKQESEGETRAYNDDDIEQDEIWQSTNDYAVKKEPSIESKDALAGITQELLNVDNIDAQQKANVPKLIIVKLSQSVIDKYVCQSPTTHPVTEIYPEDRRENTFDGQSTEHPETKQEIEVKGIEQDGKQDNTNDCEGRDHASEAQSGCYKKQFTCDYCFKIFSYKSKLLNHIRVHTGEKPFSCDICLKKFLRKSQMSKHIFIHTGEKPFSCDICSKKFTLKFNLNAHKQIHIGEKPFSCDICSKKFTRKFSLNVHKQIHRGEKPFTCDICSKKFSEKRNLNRHILIHTGEKPFTCYICSKKFSDKRNLNRHILIHTGEQPFSCDICLKKFSEKRNLNRHKQIHRGEKPFSCNICLKKFSDKRNLNRHILIHIGEKPFSCDICSKKFTQKVCLNLHKQIHKGEESFSCYICPKKFNQKSSLNPSGPQC